MVKLRLQSGSDGGVIGCDLRPVEAHGNFPARRGGARRSCRSPGSGGWAGRCRPWSVSRSLMTSRASSAAARPVEAGLGDGGQAEPLGHQLVVEAENGDPLRRLDLDATQGRDDGRSEFVLLDEDRAGRPAQAQQAPGGASSDAGATRLSSIGRSPPQRRNQHCRYLSAARARQLGTASSRPITGTPVAELAVLGATLGAGLVQFFTSSGSVSRSGYVGNRRGTTFWRGQRSRGRKIVSTISSRTRSGAGA